MEESSLFRICVADSYLIKAFVKIPKASDHP